jgi:hypothetical protein
MIARSRFRPSHIAGGISDQCGTTTNRDERVTVRRKLSYEVAVAGWGKTIAAGLSPTRGACRAAASA